VGVFIGKHGLLQQPIGFLIESCRISHDSRVELLALGPQKASSEFIDYHTITYYRMPYAFTKQYYRLQELIRMEFRRILWPLSLTRHLSNPTRSRSFRQWFSAQNWLMRFIH
jgi:hypothetical protein